jgi:hypothetical protein
MTIVIDRTQIAAQASFSLVATETKASESENAVNHRTKLAAGAE